MFDTARALRQSAPRAGDPATNRLPAVLAAIESDLGEAAGWGSPPLLLLLDLHPRDRQALVVIRVDERTWWPPGGGCAPLALQRFAAGAPDPVEQRRLPLAQAPFGAVAVAFLAEAWLRPVDQLRAPSEAPLEARVLSTVDANGEAYSVVRRRGNPGPHVTAGGHCGVGAIPAALRRLALARRAGRWPS